MSYPPCSDTTRLGQKPWPVYFQASRKRGWAMLHTSNMFRIWSAVKYGWENHIVAMGLCHICIQANTNYPKFLRYTATLMPRRDKELLLNSVISFQSLFVLTLTFQPTNRLKKMWEHPMPWHRTLSHDCTQAKHLHLRLGKCRCSLHRFGYALGFSRPT